jgi:hypothetical protein
MWAEQRLPPVLHFICHESLQGNCGWHWQIKCVLSGKVDVIEKKGLLRYSIQLSMLRQLLNKKLISELEYEKIKKRLMKDYNVVSDITT